MTASISRLRHLFLAIAFLLSGSAAQAADKLVVAFGDSLMAGYQLAPGDGFVPQMQAALQRSGVAARVHNAGVSGDTSAQGRARLGWVLGSLGAKPDLVILELGANDMLRGLDPAQTRANIDAMLAELKKRQIRVLLAGMMAPPNLGAVYGGRFNAIYPDLARKYSVRLYPFFMAGVADHSALQIADAMHPNRDGVGVIVRSILPVVRSSLK